MGITLGIIGGIAPPSTVEYYRALVDGYRERRPDGYPSIIINSIDLTRLPSAACATLASSEHGSRCWERSTLTSLPDAE